MELNLKNKASITMYLKTVQEAFRVDQNIYRYNIEEFRKW